jgi:S1-C subfamily serine protease
MIHGLAAALAFAVAGLCTAQTAAPAAPPAAPPANIEAKRAELDRLQREMAQLGRRMADLSREVGGPSPRAVMHRRGEPRIGLGVVLGETTDGGARIAAVTPGGPADKAGLKAGDILRSAHGKAVEDPEALVAALRGIQKGQAVNVGYLRDGRSASAAVIADELPGRAAFDWTGESGIRAPHPHDVRKRVEIITEDVSENGVRVVTRSPRAMQVFTCVNGEGDCDARVIRQAFRFRGLNLSSLDADLGRYFGTEQGALLVGASEALPGLKSGDVITTVDGRAVTSPRDVMRALNGKETGETLKLRVLRNRAAQEISVTVPEGRPLDFLPPPPPAPPTPPAPPAPPAGAAPPPPTPPAPPADGAVL